MTWKKSLFVIVVLLLIAGGAFYYYQEEAKKPTPVGALTPVPEGSDWINLLDDKHAEAWKNLDDDKEIFEIKDEMLHIFGHTITPLRYATYDAEDFGDFELHLEFKLAPGANSGLFVRSIPGDSVYRGFEIQIQDDFGKVPDKNSCGSIYDIVTPMFNMVNPAGEWNSYDIKIQGKEVIVHLNGWMVIHTDLAKMTTPLGKFEVAYNDMQVSGRLMLQDHGGEAWYRNMRIKKL